MTPAHTDSPLRRSEAGIFREGAQNQRPQHNDDEEERRQARRRTLLQSGSETDASTVEQSETLKKCLEIFHENKLSKDNAWSLSVIDTVSALLERHHKSLNNFKVAGSSLEASSKVYGLRVDSVHTDVLRMSAGLNARKFRGNVVDDDDDGVATGGEGGADPNSSAGTGIEPATTDLAATQKRKPKRPRKPVATVTKNKETLNARLDTVPSQDPVFGKLNSTVGSINASNRLMNNMLHTVDAELRLRMSHKFWDPESSSNNCDYTVPVPLDNIPEAEFLPCERLCKLDQYENLLLRPMNSGYIISDTPEASAEAEDVSTQRNTPPADDGDGGCLFADVGDTSMAFDMDAECAPLPELNAYAPIIAVDEQDYHEYTAEEHNAIGNCRGLRKSAVVIEDMRPINSTSNLEYSYRPVEKISQFWAGPSHWRFRRTRHRTSAIGHSSNQQPMETVGRALNARNRRVNALQSKKRLKVEFITPIQDAQFKMFGDYKARKANVQKKWDQRKLRLPTDLNLNAEKLVRIRYFAPALSSFINDSVHDEDELDMPQSQLEDAHFNADDQDEVADSNVFCTVQGTSAVHELTEGAAEEGDRMGSCAEENQPGIEDNNTANDTVLEIATDFEGAPRQVTKIVVPFAKRAKVIDMKMLKRSCTQLISKQLSTCIITEPEMPQHPIPKNEHYTPGIGSFKEVYKRLPALLTPTMAEGLTPSIAVYSVLHLANDFSYRLIPQDDLEDFKIRQVKDN